MQELLKQLIALQGRHLEEVLRINALVALIADSIARGEELEDAQVARVTAGIGNLSQELQAAVDAAKK